MARKKLAMRKLAGVVFIIFFGIVAPLTASGQTPGAARGAQPAAILAEFADDGPGLGRAIAAAVKADPSSARAVVAAAAAATSLQQQAIGAGLAAAQIFFDEAASGDGRARQRTRQAQREIENAIASAPGLAQTAFAVHLVAFGGDAASDTSRCVSPSQGHGRCDNHP